MPLSLTDQDISATYKGLIHSQGTSLPITGQVRLHDGDGTPTSLYIGANGNGAAIQGNLNVIGTLSAPNLDITTNITAPNAAKAWVCFKGSNIYGAQDITSSHNVATVSRVGVGSSQVYSVVFTANAVKDANYCYQLNYTTSKNDLANKVTFAFIDSVAPPSVNSINLCFRVFNGGSTTPFDPTTASLTIYNT
jgi:hypothetical protein